MNGGFIVVLLYNKFRDNFRWVRTLPFFFARVSLVCPLSSLRLCVSSFANAADRLLSLSLSLSGGALGGEASIAERALRGHCMPR